MAEKYQKIVATGFLAHEGKVLVVKRAEMETFLPGYFELPGGKIDFGEDPKAALEREFQEEVKLSINVGKSYKTFAYVTNNGERHTVEIVFLATLTEDEQEVVLGKDHTEYHWIEKEEVDDYTFTDEARECILEGFGELLRNTK